MRVAFVGQELYFRGCAMEAPAAGVLPVFVDHRGGADPEPMLRGLRAVDPDVVVVFRPEIVPPGALRELRALTLGFNTEPLPRGDAADDDRAFRLGELAQTDTTQFDRIMTFDPHTAAAAEAAGITIWRSMPLPVADSRYAAVHAAAHPPRVGFVGYSTEHRERWLVDAKHHFDVLHVVHGIAGEELAALSDRLDVAINLHAGPSPSFENRVCSHLAAGHLVLSEPLDPTHGLEPGIDFVEVRTPRALTEAIVGLHAYPDVHSAIRRRGRRKAERFRASHVWPRVLGDLRREVGRRLAAPVG